MVLAKYLTSEVINVLDGGDSEDSLQPFFQAISPFPTPVPEGGAATPRGFSLSSPKLHAVNLGGTRANEFFANIVITDVFKAYVARGQPAMANWSWFAQKLHDFMTQQVAEVEDVPEIVEELLNLFCAIMGFSSIPMWSL